MDVKAKLDMLEKKIKEVIKEISWVDEDGGIEIYTDYRDREISSNTIKKLLSSSRPSEAFIDMLYEWALDYAVNYGDNEIEEEILNRLTNEERELYSENSSEMWQVISDNIYFYYNEDDFNNNVNVNIMIDCGNWNYDCTCDNVLNWYGNTGEGDIEETSSMLWLANTQGKAELLKKVCKDIHRLDGYYVDRKINKDKFIESCVQEFENLSSHMGTVTFLVSMPLLKLFDLIELQESEYEEKGKYDPRLNERSKSYIVLGKETMCGLYNPWDGGGSVLEIELDKDIEIPIKYCKFTVDGCKEYGYDVGEVYGMCGDAWQDTLKEIVIKE